jgi:hypothetical protein
MKDKVLQLMALKVMACAYTFLNYSRSNKYGYNSTCIYIIQEKEKETTKNSTTQLRKLIDMGCPIYADMEGKLVFGPMWTQGSVDRNLKPHQSNFHHLPRKSISQFLTTRTLLHALRASVTDHPPL